MSVYVDEIWHHGRTANMPYPESCHMLADSEEELQTMALKLGLKLSWQHKDHFDITPPKRRLAIRYGAIEMPILPGINECCDKCFKRIIRQKTALLRQTRKWYNEKNR